MSSLGLILFQIHASYSKLLTKPLIFSPSQQIHFTHLSPEAGVNCFLLRTMASSPRWRALSAVTVSCPRSPPSRLVTRTCSTKQAQQPLILREGGVTCLLLSITLHCPSLSNFQAEICTDAPAVSYVTSTFNAMHFDKKNPSTCLCKKENKKA